MKKKKIFVIMLVDVIVLLFLLLASSTDLILKERLQKSYKITALIDAVSSEKDENFKLGLKKGAVDWNMDLNLSYISDYEDVEGIENFLQKEVDNGSTGLILNCKNKKLAEAITSFIPVGMPVVLWDMELESSRVKGSVSSDKETKVNLLLGAIMDGRTEGEDVAIIEQNRGCSDAKVFHEQLEKKLSELGVQARVVKIEELSSAETLVKGMAVQKKNILVSADFKVLKSLAESCQQSKITLPLYGVGWELSARNLLEEGYISGLVVHRSYEAGYLTLSKLAGTIQKEDTGTDSLSIENVLITPENMYQRDIEIFIFPYT